MNKVNISIFGVALKLVWRKLYFDDDDDDDLA